MYLLVFYMSWLNMHILASYFNFYDNIIKNLFFWDNFEPLKSKYVFYELAVNISSLKTVVIWLHLRRLKRFYNTIFDIFRNIKKNLTDFRARCFLRKIAWPVIFLLYTIFFFFLNNMKLQLILAFKKKFWDTLHNKFWFYMYNHV